MLIKKEPVLAAGTLLAIVSMFVVPPDAEYSNYIDIKTLACLFSLMLALKGLERENILKLASEKITAKIKNARMLAFFLVFLCFFISMLMTNDVALIALVPLAMQSLASSGQNRHTAFVVVLQTLAANVGSSLTPVGNPQNLYLYSRYSLTLSGFVLTVLPYVAAGGVFAALCCLIIPPEPIEVPQDGTDSPGNGGRMIHPCRGPHIALYGTMFAAAVLAVFGVLPYIPVLCVSVLLAAIFGRRTLAAVDYSLIATFAVIFIFVGNISRIPAASEILSAATEKSALFTAVITSQFTSNVPAALLLSGFTDDARGLLAGVNIGGLGTLIASMASVISFKLYTAENKSGAGRYMLIFTAVNIAGLAVLCALAVLYAAT